MTSISSTDRALPLNKLFVSLLVLAICSFYALTTLLYVSPNNPMRVQFDAEMSAFEKWGYQKWTFFAPPPKDRDRLYFAFSPKNGEGITIEVLEGIYARKRQDNPLNVKTQVVDYVISGTARAISDGIREVYRYRKAHELWGGDVALLDDLAVKSLRADDPNVRVLLRYAAMVAAEQGIELEELKCQIVFAHVPLPPFSQRHNERYPIEEQLLYKTNIMDVPSLVYR